MIEESKHCIDVMKKHFNKELIMTKEDDEDSENSTKCWICDNAYVDGEVNGCVHYIFNVLFCNSKGEHS